MKLGLSVVMTFYDSLRHQAAETRKHCITPFENVDSASTFVGVQYSVGNGASMFVGEQYSAGNGASMFVGEHYSAGNGVSMFADVQLKKEMVRQCS
jgi:hypothetical protein